VSPGSIQAAINNWFGHCTVTTRLSPSCEERVGISPVPDCYRGDYPILDDKDFTLSRYDRDEVSKELEKAPVYHIAADPTDLWRCGACGGDASPSVKSRGRSAAAAASRTRLRASRNMNGLAVASLAFGRISTTGTPMRSNPSAVVRSFRNCGRGSIRKLASFCSETDAASTHARRLDAAARRCRSVRFTIEPRGPRILVTGQRRHALLGQLCVT
jgi:hypothetical protein